MSFYGVGINSAVERLQLQIKFNLSSLHGGMALRKLERAFDQANTTGGDRIDFYVFEDALRKVGIFYGKIDSQALFNFYDTRGDGSICYKEFLESLK